MNTLVKRWKFLAFGIFIPLLLAFYRGYADTGFRIGSYYFKAGPNDNFTRTLLFLKEENGANTGFAGFTPGNILGEIMQSVKAKDSSEVSDIHTGLENIGWYDYRTLEFRAGGKQYFKAYSPEMDISVDFGGTPEGRNRIVRIMATARPMPHQFIMDLLDDENEVN